MGTKEAVAVSILRIILTGFLFGNMFAILYSLAGGLLSFLVMLLLERIGLHMVFVSVAGGISHNIGQLFVAALVVDNYNILFYIPVLLIAGILTGLLIGILSQKVVLRVKLLKNPLQYHSNSTLKASPFLPGKAALDWSRCRHPTGRLRQFPADALKILPPEQNRSLSDSCLPHSF